MNLFPENFNLLEWLLGKSIKEGLTAAEERTVRILVSVEHPSALDKPMNDVIDIGLMMVGTRHLADQIDKILNSR